MVGFLSKEAYTAAIWPSDTALSLIHISCEVFDALHWDNVVGTLSGDDTFFILMRTEETAGQICKELKLYVSNH